MSSESPAADYHPLDVALLKVKNERTDGGCPPIVLSQYTDHERLSYLILFAATLRRNRFVLTSFASTTGMPTRLIVSGLSKDEASNNPYCVAVERMKANPAP